MTTNGTIRASDQDREHVVEVLRTHYADGRLNLEEFNERVAAAYESRTWGDLRHLTRDLPGDVLLGPDPAAQAQASATAPTPANQPPPGPPAWLPPRLFPLVPLLLAFLVISAFAWGGGYPGHHHDGHFVPFFSVWPFLVLFLVFMGRSRRWHRGGPRGRRGPYR